MRKISALLLASLITTVVATVLPISAAAGDVSSLDAWESRFAVATSAVFYTDARGGGRVGRKLACTTFTEGAGDHRHGCVLGRVNLLDSSLVAVFDSHAGYYGGNQIAISHDPARPAGQQISFSTFDANGRLVSEVVADATRPPSCSSCHGAGSQARFLPVDSSRVTYMTATDAETLRVLVEGMRAANATIK